MPSQEQAHSNDQSLSRRQTGRPEAQRAVEEQPMRLTSSAQQATSDPRSLTPREMLQLQRTHGNQAVNRILSRKLESPSIRSGNVRVQRQLATTASDFDTATTIPKSGFFSSEKKLDGIITALKEYESRVGSAEAELSALRKIFAACNTAKAESSQVRAITDLKFKVLSEVKTILPTLILSRLGVSPSESLYRSTFNGNIYTELAVSNDYYQPLVQSLVIDLSRVDSALATFLASTPALGDTEEKFIKSFKDSIAQSNQRITVEALNAITPKLVAERNKRLAREADKKHLKSMFNFDIDLLTPAPNQVTSVEFDQIAELYSRVREGDSNIKFANRNRTGSTTFADNAMDANTFEVFKTKALADIAKILQTPQGRTVLTGLHAGGKTGASNFTLGGVSNPLLAGQQANDGTAGADGTGTGSGIYYDPGTDINLPLDSGKSPLETTSDTALFHELVHAYHGAQGTLKPSDEKLDLADVLSDVATPMRDLGVRKEEYATVGLGSWSADDVTENAYRANHRTLAGSDQTLADKYKKRESYL